MLQLLIHRYRGRIGGRPCAALSPIAEHQNTKDTFPSKRGDCADRAGAHMVAPRSQAMPAATAAPRILVVDDDQDTCENLADILLDAGYSPDAVSNCGDALELVQQQRYSMAILDFRMPVMDGLSLFERLKDVQPDVQGVVITGFSTAAVAGPASSSGVRRVLRKPLDGDELLRVVQEVLGAP